MTDADAHKDGIGPCYYEFDQGMSGQWWAKWKHIVTITKFGRNGSEFCPLSPWNVSDGEYDKFKGSRPAAPGSNSVDALFFHAGDPEKKMSTSVKTRR